jgi:fatty-acid desaturase
MHLGCLPATFVFSWIGLGIALLLTWLTAAVGITLCYHRLLAHRSFKTPTWFKYLLTLIACLAWQGGPIQWVGVHRIHHAYSDHERDPHSPLHGFVWAHMFWFLLREPVEQRLLKAAGDLQRDSALRWINKWFWVPQMMLIPLLFLCGEYSSSVGLNTSGWSWLVWGICVRTVMVYHMTWLINSATHTWGYRNFETTDYSTNLWWVALLAFGEGWHNNHHAFPRSAAHGFRWFEIDLTYSMIRVLACVGLARDIVLPPSGFSLQTVDHAPILSVTKCSTTDLNHKTFDS